MTENWNVEEFKHWQKTGEKPEDRAKSAKKAEKRTRMAENALQTLCENWIHLRGYRRLTANNACLSPTSEPFKGWFGHIVNAKKNPLMSDLFIFDRFMSNSLMVELKVRDVYQPGQKEMIASGAWHVAFSFEEFEAILKEWEKKHEL